jgi:hypothetical protein
MEESEQVKRQICVMGDKENTWKKYIYLENGIPIGEKTVKIENGIEIPYGEIASTTHMLTLPQNIENEEHVEIKNIVTGELNLVKIVGEPKKIEFVKVFNQTKNIGTIVQLENGIQVSLQYYKIKTGQEIICDPPENEKFYFVPLPNRSQDFTSHKGDLFICDPITGEVLNKIHKSNIIQIDNKSEIEIKEQSDELSKEIITKINELSNQEKEQLIENIHKTCDSVTTLEGKHVFTSTIEQVAETIGNLINEIEEIPPDFYKTIDSKQEFGISRVVADKIYNLPKILENAKLVRQGETTTYIIQAEGKDSYGNLIRLEHRLQATSPQEAERVARIVLKRLKGIQLKIWVACWKMANTKKMLTFTCRLTDLMKCTNPLRNANLNSAEKLEFYEHLRSLENTKFVYTKFYKVKGRDKVESYEIRLLEIHRRSGDKNEETPQELTMTVLNVPALQKQKTTFVGVGVKNKTLELHADDTLLASFIQTRKNQNMKTPHLKLERGSLMEIAGLSKTDKINSAHANKLLLEKLQRLREKGIILICPKRINDVISLKVR